MVHFLDSTLGVLYRMPYRAWQYGQRFPYEAIIYGLVLSVAALFAKLIVAIIAVVAIFSGIQAALRVHK